MASPPKVDAFLLCDHVHRDAVTGKYTVIGTWDRLQSREFPAHHDCGVYLSLTGLNGNYEFAMKEGERLFDVGVTPEGKLLNVKEEVAQDQLPKAVKDGLQKKHPGAKIVETEKVVVIDWKKETLTYELKIKVDNKTLEVVLDEAGKVVSE